MIVEIIIKDYDDYSSNIIGEKILNLPSMSSIGFSNLLTIITSIPSEYNFNLTNNRIYYINDKTTATWLYVIGDENIIMNIDTPLTLDLNESHNSCKDYSFKLTLKTCFRYLDFKSLDGMVLRTSSGLIIKDKEIEELEFCGVQGTDFGMSYTVSLHSPKLNKSNFYLSLSKGSYTWRRIIFTTTNKKYGIWKV